MRFPEKLRDAREKAHISQTDLSTQVGVSRRSIFAYENGDSVPRKNILRKLAQALNVTVAYLTDDDSNDPDQGRAREENINMVRERFGSKGAMEAAELLDRNSAFFAGGEIPQEDKDAFFEAIMTAYVTAKTEAKKKFTPNSRKSSDGE
ncbi:MAG: helix-turn-helix transcriptional regulator [Oscillospiraceae bacterium]|nr:helix-turn-helix transcriptional regulator [Oscillospiraceae bacterium]